MVLVLLFTPSCSRSTILAALPLCARRRVRRAAADRKSLSLPALIGLLMLMGIAAKNSILLVEYAIEAERERA